MFLIYVFLVFNKNLYTNPKFINNSTIKFNLLQQTNQYGKQIPEHSNFILSSTCGTISDQAKQYILIYLKI